MATLNDIKGKAVVITGANEVGYGTANALVFGVVSMIEEYGSAEYPLTYDDAPGDALTMKLNATTATALGGEAGVTYVVTVDRHVAKENVPITSTAADRPVAGDVVVADGAGGLKKATANTSSTGAICIAVNGTTSCTVVLM